MRFIRELRAILEHLYQGAPQYGRRRYGRVIGLMLIVLALVALAVWLAGK